MESRTSPATFQAKILEATEDLQRTMLNYIIVASDASGSHLNPLLSPTLAVPREGDQAHQVPGPVPTVGDAVVALREVHSHLSQSLVEVDSYSIKLLNQDSTGMDELEEMAIASMEGVDRLEPYQRRALAFGQLEEMMQQRIKDSNDYLDSLEMLLLLLWRHIDFYVNGGDVENESGQADQAGKPAQSPASEPDPSQTLRPAMTESRSGWGISLFSPFRRKESPSPASGSGNVGVPLGASSYGGASPAGYGGNPGLGRSVLTVSALGGGGRKVGGMRGVEGREVDVFRATASTVLEPIFERLGSLQLLDDIPSLDFRVRGPYIHAFIKRLRNVIAGPEKDGGEEGGE